MNYIKQYRVEGHYDVFDTLQSVPKDTLISEISLQLFKDINDEPLFEIYSDGVCYDILNASDDIPQEVFDIRDQFISDLNHFIYDNNNN